MNERVRFHSPLVRTWIHSFALLAVYNSLLNLIWDLINPFGDLCTFSCTIIIIIILVELVRLVIITTQPTLHGSLTVYLFSVYSTPFHTHSLDTHTLHNSHTCRILRCSLSNCDENTRRCVHGAGSWHRWVWAYTSVSVSCWDVHNPLPGHTAETYMTAYSGLFWSGRLTQGETVLIHAVQWTCTVFILYSICTVLLLYQYWCVCIVLYMYCIYTVMILYCYCICTVFLLYLFCIDTGVFVL